MLLVVHGAEIGASNPQRDKCRLMRREFSPKTSVWQLSHLYTPRGLLSFFVSHFIYKLGWLLLIITLITPAEL